MSVIYVGSVFPVSRANEIRLNSKNGIDNAANNFQSALLWGLDHYYPNLKVVTLPAIRTYPLNYKKAIFKKSLFSHGSDAEDYCLGFINIPFVKYVSKYFSLYKKLFKIVDVEEETTIILYGALSPFLKAIFNLKKVRPKLSTCVIVADLPQFMSGSRNPLYLFLKKLDSILINKYLKIIDSFVLLSDYMVDALEVGKRPWTRVEGIYKQSNDLEIEKSKKSKIILYTGTFSEQSGIEHLLNAFASIDNPNYRLWICGEGKYKMEIINHSTLDHRIKYFGQIPFIEVLKLQKQATVLVNPRTSEGEFTKYSFPSKTMEYLASGTPCIMNRLPGVPNEYFNYCFVPENETPIDLRNTLLFACEKNQSELNDFGMKAKHFILENKTPEKQCLKIYNMLNKLKLTAK